MTTEALLEQVVKLAVTVGVAVIGYFLKRSLDRIELKLDLYYEVQAKHDARLQVVETRIERLESDIRELRTNQRELQREMLNGPVLK